jgi:hypothetical protein
MTPNLPIVKWFITPDCNIQKAFQESSCSILSGEITSSVLIFLSTENPLLMLVLILEDAEPCG